MASNIDPTKPVGPVAYTADVRDNFASAKAEIEELQAAMSAATPVTGSRTDGTALAALLTALDAAGLIDDQTTA